MGTSYKFLMIGLFYLLSALALADGRASTGGTNGNVVGATTGNSGQNSANSKQSPPTVTTKQDRQINHSGQAATQS